MRGYRDAVIEALADSEHALARDLAAVRECYHLTLGLFHASMMELDGLRKRYYRVLDENRRLRAERRESPKRAA